MACWRGPPGRKEKPKVKSVHGCLIRAEVEDGSKHGSDLPPLPASVRQDTGEQVSEASTIKD